MFDIPISGTGGTSPTDPSVVEPLVQTSSQTGGTTDTISSAAALGNVGLTPAGGISLKDYQGLMLSTNSELQQMVQQISVDNATRTSQMYANAQVTAQNLLQLQTVLNQVVTEEAALYQQEQTDTNNYNTSVGTYNTATNTNIADQSQITTMNNAIVAWQNANTTYDTTKATLDSELSHGTITLAQYNTQLAAAQTTLSNAQTTYNNAVTAYQTYNAGRTTSNTAALSDLSAAQTTYASQVDNVENPSIVNINTQLASVGVATLPLNSDTTPGAPTIPPLPTPPSATPVPPPGTQISYTPPAAAGTLPAPTAPPSLQTQISQAMSQLTAANAAVAFLSKIISVYQAYNDYNRYILQAGKVVVDPNTIKSRTRSVNNNDSVSVGTGAGVSLGLISTTLPNPLATLNVSNAIFNANYSDIVNTPAITATLAQVLLEDLHNQSALSAGTGALSILSGQLSTTPAGSPLATLAIALAYANQNSSLVSSDQLQAPLLTLLNAANPGADNTEAAGQLAAQAKLNFLQSSLIQLSQALNYPGLSNDIIAQANTPASEAALQASNQTTTNDVLANSLSRAAIADNLASTSEGEVSQQQAQNVINDVASQAQQGNITSQEELNASIQSSLVQQGVNQSSATALAASTSDYITAETNSAATLNASIESGQLSQQNLVEQLTQQGIKASIAQQAATSTLATTDLQTQRQLRDNLATQISIAQGNASVNLAALFAANTYIEAQTAKDTEKAQEKVKVQQSAEDLRVSIANHAIAQGATPEIAGRTVVTILGNAQQKNPTSVLNQVKAQVVALKAADKEQEVAAFRNLIRPTFDAYVESNKILDPANLVYEAATNIQMAGLEVPTNWKKGVDILV